MQTQSAAQMRRIKLEYLADIEGYERVEELLEDRCRSSRASCR